MLPQRCRRSTILLTAAAVLLAGSTVEAVAQSDGVFVDPDSPAGKEYALPLESARRGASGGGSADPSTGAAAPLFGAGISRGRGAPGEKGAEGQRGESDAPVAGDPGDSGGRGADSRRASAAVAASGGGLSAGLLTALIALAVLAVGGIAGFSVRALRGTDQAR